MSTLTAYRLRSDHWASAISRSSGAACWNRTDAAPPTIMTVPTPRLVVQVKSASLRPVAAAVRRVAPASAVTAPPPAEPEPPAAAVPSADGPLDLSALAAGDAPSPGADNNARIELIIDSLPHLSLVQSIPVTVAPIGDKIYTATVSSLNITATGASVGETLLLLKDQIESIHHELEDKSRLDEDQRKMQHLLHTYIAKSHKYVSRETKKSDWFRR